MRRVSPATTGIAAAAIQAAGLRFTCHGQPLEALEIEDRWDGDGYVYLKVFAADACRYLLRSTIAGEWSAQRI
jgi:hypothetical protein